MQNSDIVPGNVTLWSYDFDSKSATKETVLDTTGTRDFVSSAKVCNNTFVAVWDVFPTQVGLATVNLLTKEVDYVETDYLVHDIACAGGNKVLAVASIGEKKGVDFALMSIDFTTGQGTQIGSDIPHPKGEWFEGWDSIFRFSDDESKLYAAFGVSDPLFPTAPPSKSTLFVLDTATGNVSGTFEVEGAIGSNGCLYTVFDGFTRAITIHVLDTGNKLEWADLKCEKKKCKAHKTGDDSAEWTFGKPLATCGDDVWALTTPSDVKDKQPLLHSSISTGKTDEVLDLATIMHEEAGALAVVC